MSRFARQRCAIRALPRQAFKAVSERKKMSGLWRGVEHLQRRSDMHIPSKEVKSMVMERSCKNCVPLLVCMRILVPSDLRRGWNDEQAKKLTQGVTLGTPDDYFVSMAKDCESFTPRETSVGTQIVPVPAVRG